MKPTAALLLALCCTPLHAHAATPFDGTYEGSTEAAGNGNYRCTGALPTFKVTVRDGKFNYGGGDNRVPVTIAADGSFSAQSGQRYLQGKIVGNQMNATTSGDRCNYIWSLKR